MLKKLFRILCLATLLSGCSTVKTFDPIGNCRPKAVATYSCVDKNGGPYEMTTTAGTNSALVCFDVQEFKTFNESCHQ